MTVTLLPSSATMDFHVKVCQPVNESRCRVDVQTTAFADTATVCIRSFMDRYSTIAGGHSKQASGSRYHVQFISLIQASSLFMITHLQTFMHT